MNQNKPLYESDELRVYGFADQMVFHSPGPCYCGDPGDPSQEPGELIPASTLLGSAPGDTVIADILGDSMIEAGIMPGDKVVINRQAVPADGNVVLACIEGQVTLKYLQHDREGRTWLVPANAKLSPLRVDIDGERCRIDGVMVSVVHPCPVFDAVLRGRLDEAVKEMYPLVRTSDAEPPFGKYINPEKDKRQVLARLHTLLDGREGAAVIKTLVAAKAIQYLNAMPPHAALTSEFSIRLNRSQYYRDKGNHYDEDEIRDIIDQLR